MRTLTYTAKCSRSTHTGLHVFLEQQRLLWNAGLEQRKTAYQRQGVSLTAYAQYKQLTELRSDGDFGQYHVGCQRSALNRLHKAFQAFFARVKAGQEGRLSTFQGPWSGAVVRVSEPAGEAEGQAVGAERQGRGQVPLQARRSAGCQADAGTHHGDALPRQGAVARGYADMRLEGMELQS